MSLTKLCSTADFELDQDILKAELEGYEPFAVYLVDGEYFVTGDACSHAQASLSEAGRIEGREVLCTLHDGRFDLQSGIPTAAPCSKPIHAYEVTQKGYDLYIDPDAPVDPELFY